MDPVGLASNLTTLVGFALQSSKELHQTLDSFKKQDSYIREFKTELEALETVLGSLRKIADDTDIELYPLKLPLLQCGSACAEFKAIIAKHISRSNTIEFKTLIASYKSTIVAALINTNM